MASWIANDYYTAGDTEFDITVTKARTNVILGWKESEISCTFGEAPAANELQLVEANGVELSTILPLVVYSSSNPEVATVDANGNISVVSYGLTYITAQIDPQNEDYSSEAVSYPINVINPNQPSSATFDFTNNTYGLKEITSSSEYEKENYSIAQDEVKIDFDVISGFGFRYWSSGKDLRVYTGTQVIIYAPTGYYLTKIEFTTSDNKFVMSAAGLKDKVWTRGENQMANSVQFNVTGTTTLSQISVTYVKGPDFGAPTDFLSAKEGTIVKNGNDLINNAFNVINLETLNSNHTYKLSVLEGEASVHSQDLTNPIINLEPGVNNLEHGKLYTARIDVTFLGETKSSTVDFLTQPLFTTDETDASIAEYYLKAHGSGVNIYYNYNSEGYKLYNNEKFTKDEFKTLQFYAEVAATEPRTRADEVTALRSPIVTIDDISVSVADIDADNQPVRFFDIQGRPVNADALAPGLYIRIQAGKAQKVIISER